MLAPRWFRALGALEARSLVADPLLRWMALLPLLVAAAVRFVLPPLLQTVGELAGLDLIWLQPRLAGYVVVAVAPLLAGSVVGLLLLDQRDERTLLALRVTPLPLGRYLAYKLATPIGVALATTLAAIAVAGGLNLAPAAALVAALGATPLAPLVALALATFARNKLEGLALVKAATILLVAPLAALFLPPPAQFALLPLPTTLVARVVWALQAGEPAWFPLLGSWLLAALLVALLLRRLQGSIGP